MVSKAQWSQRSKVLCWYKTHKVGLIVLGNCLGLHDEAGSFDMCLGLHNCF